jgi:predicted esterase
MVRAQATKYDKPQAYQLTAADRQALTEQIAELERAIAKLPPVEAPHRDALADVMVYAKAGTWALRFGEFYTQKDVAMTLDVLKRGLERAQAFSGGRRPWQGARGESIRGYESKVEGSFQPYAVAVPDDLDPAQSRVRLDVVLHGRGATRNEARFIAEHDGKPADEGATGKVTLHVFGRTNNAYRWAGEADVFEAIEAVKRNYSIDERRIVLRGFSMGGAGGWHLGLHHPSLWSSVEAGAGFAESKRYARLEELPEYQEKALHIYDAVDYAANAFNVPMAGYGGEEDPQRQASIEIEEALKSLGYEMKTEGLLTRGAGIDFLRVVGAKMGHQVDPPSEAILKAFHDERAVKGLDLNPSRVKFVTYTLKYNQAPWLAVESLKEHYRRAWVDAEIQDRTVVVRSIENVAVLSVFRQMGQLIRFGDQEFPLESAVRGLLPRVYFRQVGEQWQLIDHSASRAFEENVERGKRHNLQGPIDDAFTAPFLCVVGSGKAWHDPVQEWAEAKLKSFADEWRQFLRGEVRVKRDTEVTPDDIEGHHLILFGDPGSNRFLARVLKDLPLEWTETEISLGGRTFSAQDHVPVLVTANPVNPLRYVVVNSGHTFGAREFRGTNALLFPRLGDYAVFEVASDAKLPEVSGFFDEKWKSR